MRGRRFLLAALAIGACVATYGQTQGSPAAQAARPAAGWTVPEDAPALVNPVPASETAMVEGRKIYEQKCQRCHGASGKGDGPDADPDLPPDDLSDPARAERNPDGVVFYKVWNGRSKPRMPAFSADLTRQEVWTLIRYVQSLRAKKP
jgi:mono/diheme cytochrome c family protein